MIFHIIIIIIESEKVSDAATLFSFTFPSISEYAKE